MEVDQTREQLEATNQRLRQIEKQLELAHKQTAGMLELLEKQERRLSDQETSIARLDRILMELLTGRTWRTLRATGDLVKRLMPKRSGGGASVALTNQKSFLVCDEPKRGDRTPRSGEVTIRGWALAEGGVDSVQLEIPGLPLIETKPAEFQAGHQEDSSQSRPEGRSGFVVRFDSLQLPRGFVT